MDESVDKEPSSRNTSERFAYVTLVTSDVYVDGALVLLHSLRRTLTPHSILCLVTPVTLSHDSLHRLQQHFDGVIETDLHESYDTCNLALLGRPDLRSTLTKIQLWHPALFGAWSAICYLDADTLVRQSIDDVFSRFYDWRSDESAWEQGGLVAAAPDTGWPDCFNSGVLLLAPGLECYHALQRRTAQSADQGLLNEHFADWSRTKPYRRLPFLYNATANVYYTYEPALQRFGHDVRVVHFIGISKPWHWERTASGQLQSSPSTSERWCQLVNLWWNIHDEHVSGWKHWRGPFVKEKAFGQGYHHITEPIKSEQPEPQRYSDDTNRIVDNQLLSSEEYTQEVADWDKDWSWANDRVHPLDYTYLTSHTKIIEPSTKLNMPEARSRDHLLHKQWQQSEEQTDAITDATSQSNFSHTTNISPSISQKQHQTSNEHFNATSEPQMSSPDFDGTKSPKHPAWIQSQRPWEDVAREGWMHSDEFQPHSYDQAYTRRHIDTPRYDKPQIERQPHRSLHSSESRHDWQTEYSPMPIPSNRPIYEAQQVVLQPRFEQHTTHNHQYEQHNKETDHHDHGQISTSPNHHHRTLEHDSYFWPHSGDDGNPSYRQNVADERDTLSRSSGSPIYYPQPKSPMVVNPVALWESSEEQARRRAWAHQVTAPIENELKSHESYHNASQTASMPSADAGIPLSAMDHIDSSSLPQETPWKISHVRQRPTEATDMNNDIVPGHLGMQFKEGVANDASARDAAGQLLKRWNEAVVARNIQTRFGNIDPHQLSHSVVSPEKGTDAIRLETTVSCEAEDSKGERTVYRFTLSSTLDIGGAKTSPVATAPVWAPEKHTQPNLAALANGRQDGVPIADIARYDQPEPFPTKPSKITDNASVPTVLNLMQNDMEQKTDNRYYDYNNIVSLPQPKNYQEPAISRRSSFVQLQRNAARAPYMALQSGYDNADQFAESDARYWKLQRQLIDLEMSQQQHENKSTNDNELVALAVNTSAGREMIQDQNKLDLASPPTPSLAPTLSYQPEPGGLLRRRPSAFSIADPASFTLDNKQIDSLPSAPAEIPSKKPTQLSRRRSQSSPRLMEGSVRLNNSGKLKVDDTQARFKRSRSQSTLRRIATENSTQAKMKLAKPQEKPESTARPMFTTASSDSSESEESLDSGVDSDEESFRPTYGRMPTPFPRHLRRSAAANKQADVAQIKADEHGDKDSARSRSSSAGFGSTNFGLPIDISGRENSPGKAKFDSKLKWGDEDEDLIPPDTDRSLEAQWRRIIYGAPPPRTHVAAAVHKIPLNQPESSKANPVAKLPDFANDKEGAEGAHVSSCRIDKLPSAEIGSLENCDVDSTGIDETELGIVETNQPDTLQPPIQGQPEPKAFSKNPGSNVRAPPRKLHSTKSFLNMGSQEFETLSDAEEDSSEVEMQQRFWERAIKPSKSGMSTPYSPGRRKSLTEMSSMISPKDLEEWMRWQGDNNGTLSRDISNDILDESGEGKMQQQGSQELITPPVSKSKTSLDAIPSVDKADVIKELASSQDESTDDGDSMLFMTLSNPSHNLSLSPATELGTAGGSDQDMLLLSGSDDQTCRIWDTRTGRAIHGITNFAEEITAVGFVSENCLAIASGSAVNIYDQRSLAIVVQSHNTLAEIKQPANGGEIQGLSARGDFVAWVDEDGYMSICDITDPNHLVRFSNPHEALASCVCFHPEEPILATGGFDQMVVVWDVASEARISSFKPPTVNEDSSNAKHMINPPFVYSVDFAPTEEYMVVSGHADGKIMCSRESGSFSLQGHNYSVSAL
ncbi:glycogenin glucosyltransferase [Coemansia brasiliensis]|uniref:glycogenin glucosyltransferase n=1 Tax=Coemansia brasiliensis TaxID=2650707 RepID=A0A9W8I9A1_9FUNG|nr:glycogenin glucosyltransferase [Coemansia brasiliensis]